MNEKSWLREQKDTGVQERKIKMFLKRKNKRKEFITY